ncbi:MAG: ribosome biogenesis GTPase Der [Chlamydiota bacterium]|nr:ribosome biogenesis GTPase Der [Chlamydiota bacterium]
MTLQSHPKNIPIVAIVGRTNVGKSSLFNRFLHMRKAIVHSDSGVTRDRIEMDWCWDDYSVRLVDTGGGVFDSTFHYADKIHEQIQQAIEIASLLLFVVDGQTGVLPNDLEMASVLRQSGKQVLLVVNKIEHPDMDLAQFYKLGFNHMYCVSAMHDTGISELIQAIEERIDPVPFEKSSGIRLAVIGKPNVGKSTLVNQLIGDNRLIVDDVPGTTRDAIEVPFAWKDNTFVLVDTAGVRRERKVKEPLEYYSVNRSLKSIKNSDIVLLLVDARDGLSRQDVDILKHVYGEGKGCVMAFNKWDLTKELGIDKDDYFEEITRRWPHLDIYPRLNISAIKGAGFEKMMALLLLVYSNAQKRVSTPHLNRILEKSIKRLAPPSQQGKKLRINYMTQVHVMPTEFVLFVNDVRLVSKNYLMYLEHKIREEVDFQGIPFSFRIKHKQGENKCGSKS